MLSTDILHTMLSVCMISVVNKYTFWASNRNCETLPQLVNVHDLSHAFSDGNNKKLCVRKTLQRKKQSSTLKWKPFCRHNSDNYTLYKEFTFFFTIRCGLVITEASDGDEYLVLVATCLLSNSLLSWINWKLIGLHRTLNFYSIDITFSFITIKLKFLLLYFGSPKWVTSSKYFKEKT